MKRIEFTIQRHLEQRLQKHTVLILYDPERRYHAIATALLDARTFFVDGSESTITGREAAMAIWCRLGELEHENERLLIYLPIEKPVTMQEKQKNPWQIFALGGGEFPESDSESFYGLCLAAAPDLAGQIKQLFDRCKPDFAMVNNLLAGSTNWPQLKTLLKADSAAEILVSMLSPSPAQKAALLAGAGWLAELTQFCSQNLACKLAGTRFDAVNQELWRFVLYSEFVFDLPSALPAALQQVPRAPEQHKPLVYNVCDFLRSSSTHQQEYLKKAEEVARELNLEPHMAQTTDLGIRDTFAFEERTFLFRFTAAAADQDFTRCEEILRHRRDSLWTRNDSVRQGLWALAERALQLLITAQDMEPLLQSAPGTVSSLIELYINRFRLLDREQRNLESTVRVALEEAESMEGLINQARQSSAHAAEKLQALFIAAVQKEGWPASGYLRQGEAFDRIIAPFLAERKKVAFFMVDALRYELAYELENQLSAKHRTELTAVCAQMPTITTVGMASLMPGAQNKMQITTESGSIVPEIDGKKIRNPSDRFAFLASLYGDRCQMNDLEDLLSVSTPRIDPAKQLWVIKTTTIDDLGEISASIARQYIADVLKNIIAGVNVVKKKGFDHAVIATDHGFLLLPEHAPGDLVAKPHGEWIAAKSRFLLGCGSNDAMTAGFTPEELGIRGDFKTLAVPKSFGTFVKGDPYYHGGLSLQEAVLPVLTISFDHTIKEAKTHVNMNLAYRGGTSTRITTRRPMIDVVLFADSLFPEDIKFQLQALAGEEVVGEPAAGENVDPATGWITLKGGQAIRVPLRMHDDFQGAFQVHASDPLTKIIHASLDLQTDYMD